MIRNLKALGLALVAIFAMGAVVASAASAQVGQGFLTSDGPVTLDTKENTEVGAGPNKLTAFGGQTTCPGTVFTGHKYNVTPHTYIPVPATTATITAHYGPCHTKDKSGASFFTTVDMNKCDFVFHVGTTTPAGAINTYGVSATVVCQNVGEHIQVTLFSSSSEALRVCTITITDPKEVSGPHLTTDTVKDDINIKGTFGPFTVHKSGLCGAEEDKDGTLHIDATITGTNANKEPTNVTITDS
jgi:hypothetical protein